LDQLEVAPTHAYYFATPAIFRPQSALFAGERFKEFLDIYVNGFWQLSQALRARQPRLSIFYPSSVSVTERPQGMTEYTMAKAAGEVLSADMNTNLAPMHVTVNRLPRLPTDQTASVVPAETALPLDIILPIVREVQSWPR
jgi:NAD(P)-dependent dehydrogenase (short-subunit alcohol dehydrogenase family)